MPGGTEKRKEREDESNAAESPRKRPLNDAFKSLSIQAKHKRHLQEYDDKNCKTPDAPLHTAAEVASDHDVEMRDRSSYAKDAHTIVVESLEDDSEVEEEEPLYVFNLPDNIDTTFAGKKSIPAAILEKYREPENQQVVLYKGTAAEVVSRSLHTQALREAQDQIETNRFTLLEDDEDAMDID